MDAQEIHRIRTLSDQFQQDRLMQGYSENSREQTLWGQSYFYEFLKTRDESTLHGITADTMHAYQMYLFNLIGKRGKPLSQMSQMHALVSVRVLFRWMVRRGFMLADPTAALALPKQKDPLPKSVMTKSEMERVLNAPDVDTPLGLRNRTIMEVMYSTGIRNKEVRSLLLTDVNTREGEVHVREGKGGVPRVVPLGEVACRYVETYVQDARPRLLSWKEDPGYLFIGRRGRKMDATSINHHIVQRSASEAGLKKHITAHGFRHTCATHMLRGRASLRHIQRLLGHKSLESTQIYLRVEVNDLKREMKRCHPREQAQ
jgi:integrase/recombinase XerD